MEIKPLTIRVYSTNFDHIQVNGETASAKSLQMKTFYKNESICCRIIGNILLVPKDQNIRKQDMTRILVIPGIRVRNIKRCLRFMQKHIFVIFFQHEQNVMFAVWG